MARYNYLDFLYNPEIYSIILPFLLIFLVIYALLRSSNIFSGNKWINVIISTSVSLMAIRFGLVDLFYREIFMRFGIILIIAFAVLIIGLFVLPIKYHKFLMILLGIFSIGVLLFALIDAFDFLGWIDYDLWDNYPGLIVLLGLFLAFIIWYIGRAKAKFK